MDLKVREQIARAPRSPGVYLFKDASGKVLYVGKAKSLRNRLPAYTRPAKEDRPSVHVIGRLAKTVEWILTDNEKEALLLENSLIKSYRPKYNIMLRDDKSYVSLKMTKHEFPALFVTRKISKDGGRYFGPFSSAHDLREMLKTIQKIFQIRDCSDSFFANRSRPCLQHQIRRCTAPCVGKVSAEDYDHQIQQAIQFIKGDKSTLIKRLRGEMGNASEELRYEDAARLRDRMRAIEDSLLPQKVESRKGAWSGDAIGIRGDQQATLIKILKIREGRVMGSKEFFLAEPISAKEEILRSFFQQVYVDRVLVQDFPQEVIFSIPMPDRKAFEEVFLEKHGKKIRIKSPRKGTALKVLKLAERNAFASFEERKRRSSGNQKLLEDLQRKLHLSKFPHRIEGYDISNLQGTHSVGSLVVFTDGEPDKNLYRQYNIKSVNGPNDFASLKEVFTRRFSKEDRKDFPDLVLVDGGKGQLRQLTDLVSTLNLHELPVCSLAKEKELVSRSGTKYAPERVFLPGQKNALVFPPSSQVLHLLMRVRDEAHRFGITRHRKARGKRSLHTVLNEIPGVGAKRKQILFGVFGTIDRIQSASVSELLQVPGISETVAKAIHAFFRQN